MTRYSYELLRYAFALFACYGVLVSVGLSRVGWCPAFLPLGTAAALGVMVLEGTWGEGLVSAMVVVLNCALAFGLGWGGFQAMLWAVRR